MAMPVQQLSVLTTDLYKIAADMYGDTTGFVQLMQQNNLNDIFVNLPVTTILAAGAAAGTCVLTLPPAQGIGVGWRILSDEIANETIVTRIIHNYAEPTIPFCNCIPGRALPPMGKLLSTTIYVSPSLVSDVISGIKVTFIDIVPSTLIVPPDPPSILNGNIQ